MGAGPSVCPEEEIQREHKDFVFFWRKDSIYSQWHGCGFKVGEQHFVCAEQWMMFNKADLFNDTEIAKEILSTTDPREHKRLGRMVRNFDPQIWDDICVDIVKLGNYEKFTQNDKLKEQILSTHPKTLVEASPLDRIWGIGLEASDPKAWDKKTWRGKNLLGYALTEVRNVIMDEEQGGGTNVDNNSKIWYAKMESAKMKTKCEGTQDLENTNEKIPHNQIDETINDENESTNKITTCTLTTSSGLDTKAKIDDPHNQTCSTTLNSQYSFDKSKCHAITEEEKINCTLVDRIVNKPSGDVFDYTHTQTKDILNDGQEIANTAKNQEVKNTRDSNKNETSEYSSEGQTTENRHEGQNVLETKEG